MREGVEALITETRLDMFVLMYNIPNAAVYISAIHIGITFSKD